MNHKAIGAGQYDTMRQCSCVYVINLLPLNSVNAEHKIAFTISQRRGVNVYCHY